MGTKNRLNLNPSSGFRMALNNPAVGELMLRVNALINKICSGITTS